MRHETNINPSVLTNATLQGTIASHNTVQIYLSVAQRDYVLYQYVSEPIIDSLLAITCT